MKVIRRQEMLYRLMMRSSTACQLNQLKYGAGQRA